ncbi:RES domain-containing protein [Phenylobacterium sp.]|uniref:RES family NAD+ phosphorylase n=1 Tax=Phenylobacterium sp. TaxID=1871053 RepID=UPI00121B2C42|nr:RES domain-containing protein [Phenylobacterium sp.]THD61626.1 MAG: RES domain-containing protein [Phenylobacterium sp.]
MTPLPPPLGQGAIVLWRLDQAVYADTWDSGEGSFQVGGRWSSAGVRAVYAALDPATAILEVAVHKGFRVLDTTPHVLTAATIVDAGAVHIVHATDVPNPNWLRPGIPSAGQQAFGDALLQAHPFVLIPSVVSTHSWNVIFTPAANQGSYTDIVQEPFALDPRLHPPSA